MSIYDDLPEFKTIPNFACGECNNWGMWGEEDAPPAYKILRGCAKKCQYYQKFPKTFWKLKQFATGQLRIDFDTYKTVINDVLYDEEEILEASPQFGLHYDLIEKAYEKVRPIREVLYIDDNRYEVVK